MSYLRSQLPHNPDFPTVAEELRKLIKRTDEIERESRIAQQKITQYEKDIMKLNGKCDAYGRRIEELEGRNLQLENRCKAVDNNALARLKNSRVANPEHTLTPLKEAGTNLPIKNFPKHEKDIRVMSLTEVTTTLRALDLPTTGPASEQKLRLREAVGRDTSTPTKALDAKAAELSSAPPSNPTPGPAVDGNTAGKGGTPAKRPPLAQRTMSVQQRKLEGIKTAKAKAAKDKAMGGAPDVRRKKVEGDGKEKEKGEAKPEVNGDG